MRTHAVLLAITVAAAIGTLVAAPALGIPGIVVPGVNATRPGGSNGGFPFNLEPFGATSQHFQEFYAGSAFGIAPVTLYGIAFRPSSDSQSKAFTATLPSVVLGLSTAKTDSLVPSTTFTDNIGVDAETVFSGPLTISSARTPAGGGTFAFDIIIPFANPFTYDPTKGALLFDVVNAGGGTSTQFDFITGGASELSEVFTLIAQGAGSPTGFVRTKSGLVTDFLTTPPVGVVTEPSGALAGFFGVALLAAARRRRA